MKLLVTIWLTMLVHLQVVSQVIPATRREPDVPPWSSLLPKIEYCEIGEQSMFDYKQGHVMQRVKYNFPEIVVLNVGEPIYDQLYCAELTLEFTYSFTPPPTPPAPPMTKQQFREKKKVEDRLKKSDKKVRELNELLWSMYPKAPPPRSFTFKGYPATEYFSAPCDYVPCPFRTSISVRFAKDRTLHLTAQRRLDQVEAILSLIDFNALDSEITKWVAAKEASDKSKEPPVSERPE